jgi:hypothetical protein
MALRLLQTTKRIFGAMNARKLSTYRSIGLLLTLLLTHTSQTFTSSITYTVPPGRFGDQLLTYCKAKWLARKYSVKFLYKPFKYSQFLLLDELESPYKSGSMARHVLLGDETKTRISAHSGLTYICDYHTHAVDWYSPDEGMFPKKHDASFVQELRRCIQPRQPLSVPTPPTDMITVALHVRKGGGFDNPLLTEQQKITKPATKFHYVDIDFPLKFPPDSYYIEQLAYLVKLLNGKPLYVFIFTDDKDPARLATKYAQALNNPDIHFDFRAQGNGPRDNVLEDFFAMTHFDCLIRGDSSYSKAAHLIGNFKVVIFPQHAVWKGRTLIIDKVGIYTSAGISRY